MSDAVGVRAEIGEAVNTVSSETARIIGEGDEPR